MYAIVEAPSVQIVVFADAQRAPSSTASCMLATEKSIRHPYIMPMRSIRNIGPTIANSIAAEPRLSLMKVFRLGCFIVNAREPTPRGWLNRVDHLLKDIVLGVAGLKVKACKYLPKKYRELLDIVSFGRGVVNGIDCSR